MLGVVVPPFCCVFYVVAIGNEALPFVLPLRFLFVTLRDCENYRRLATDRDVFGEILVWMMSKGW